MRDRRDRGAARGHPMLPGLAVALSAHPPGTARRGRLPQSASRVVAPTAVPRRPRGPPRGRTTSWLATRSRAPGRRCGTCRRPAPPRASVSALEPARGDAPAGGRLPESPCGAAGSRPSATGRPAGPSSPTTWSPVRAGRGSTRSCSPTVPSATPPPPPPSPPRHAGGARRLRSPTSWRSGRTSAPWSSARRRGRSSPPSCGTRPAPKPSGSGTPGGSGDCSPRSTPPRRPARSPGARRTSWPSWRRCCRRRATRTRRSGARSRRCWTASPTGLRGRRTRCSRTVPSAPARCSSRAAHLSLLDLDTVSRRGRCAGRGQRPRLSLVDRGAGRVAPRARRRAARGVPRRLRRRADAAGRTGAGVVVGGGDGEDRRAPVPHPGDGGVEPGAGAPAPGRHAPRPGRGQGRAAAASARWAGDRAAGRSARRRPDVRGPATVRRRCAGPSASVSSRRGRSRRQWVGAASSGTRSRASTTTGSSRSSARATPTGTGRRWRTRTCDCSREVFAASPLLDVPEPVVHVPPLRMVFYRAVAGTTLDRLAERSGACAVVLETAVLAARWLTTLHTSPAVLTRAWTWRTRSPMPASGRRAWRTRRPRPARRRSPSPTGWPTRRRTSRPCDPVAVHRDFHAGHVVALGAPVPGRRCGGPRPRRGPDGRPRLRRRLRRHLPGRGSWPGAAEVRTAFLAAYGIPARSRSRTSIGLLLRVHVHEDRQATGHRAWPRAPGRAPPSGPAALTAVLAEGAGVPGRVIYLVRSWPRLSQTFVVDEVLAQERLGTRLELYSLTRSGEELVQPQVARRCGPTVHYLDDRPRSPPCATTPCRPLGAGSPTPGRCCSPPSRPQLARGLRDAVDPGLPVAAVRLAGPIHRPRPGGRGTRRAPARPLRARPRAGRTAHRTADRGALQHHRARPRPLPDPGAQGLRARARDAVAVVTCCAANVDYLPVGAAAPAARPAPAHPPRRRAGSVRPRSARRRRPRPRSRSCPWGGWSRRRASPTCSAPAPRLRDGAAGALPAPHLRRRAAARRSSPSLRDRLGLARRGGDWSASATATRCCAPTSGPTSSRSRRASPPTATGTACPNVVVEAMACGLPVVTTDAGGITEIVRHGVNGLVAAPAATSRRSPGTWPS